MLHVLSDMSSIRAWHVLVSDEPAVVTGSGLR